MIRIILTLCLLALLGVHSSRSAYGFHEVTAFSRSANTGGGAGLYFTGSKKSKGYNCNICHVAAEQRIAVDLVSSLQSGAYKPGLIYPITVKLVGEHRGLDSAFNPNTFTAEIVDVEGNSVGRFANGDSVVKFVNDATTAVAEGFGNGEKEWTFDWQSPSEGVPATFHIALLDGDGANDPVRRFIDPLNDDVATLRIPLCPEGEVCEEKAEPGPEISPAGCSVSSTTTQGDYSLVFLMFLLIRIRQRRRETL